MLRLEAVEMLEHLQRGHVIQILSGKSAFDQIIENGRIEIIHDQKTGQILHHSTEAASFMNLLGCFHQNRFYQGVIAFSKLFQFQLKLVDLLDVVVFVEDKFPLLLVLVLEKKEFLVLFPFIYFFNDPEVFVLQGIADVKLPGTNLRKFRREFSIKTVDPPGDTLEFPKLTEFFRKSTLHQDKKIKLP